MRLPTRPADSNKSTFGHVLNIAGSLNFRGAAYLSSASALRTGAGYVTLAAIPQVIDAVAAQLPDAVFLPLPQKGAAISPEAIELVLPRLSRETICAFGCGISAIGAAPSDLTGLVETFLEKILVQKIPLVLDADGLNGLAQSSKEFHFGGNAVMTPHPGELSRLLHTDIATIQKNRIDAACAASKKWDAVVILKGKNSVIACGEKFHINDSGNSALAKAGSGDCLTGIVAGLLAQKMEPFDAAKLGAHIHGLAGEIASRELSEFGVLASDLPRYIARAIQKNRRLIFARFYSRL